MNIGEIDYLGDNMPWRIRKPFVDWRGHVPGGDYNGYAKIEAITQDEIVVLPLFGRTTDGTAVIAHPVHYDHNWKCLGSIEKP